MSESTSRHGINDRVYARVGHGSSASLAGETVEIFLTADEFDALIAVRGTDLDGFFSAGFNIVLGELIDQYTIARLDEGELIHVELLHFKRWAKERLTPTAGAKSGVDTGPHP